ncbi:MAG: lipoprotein [Lautropia sp.]|nr:lipoprotein [Lautropia sp.]
MRSLILITLASSWLLAACGQKGPLYLPSPSQPEDTRQSGILNAPPPPDAESDVERNVEPGDEVAPGNGSGADSGMEDRPAPERFEDPAPAGKP